MPNKHKCLSQRRATVSYKLLISEKKIIICMPAFFRIFHLK